jgi:hypothetical protein
MAGLALVLRTTKKTAEPLEMPGELVGIKERIHAVPNLSDSRARVELPFNAAFF